MQLKPGLTTGTCAAAAARCAARLLTAKGIPKPDSITEIEITLPQGTCVTVPVRNCCKISPSHARAEVIKDAGDDPDITHNAVIIADVYLMENQTGSDITFEAGEGVGTITKPGLQLPPEEPAINPVPRKMIQDAVRAELGVRCAIHVKLSVPGGKELARRTFNPKLGITGGISIIGTTGIVEPKSTDGWIRSLRPQIDVAVAAGHSCLTLVPGSHGEKAALECFHIHPDSIIQVSNFAGTMLDVCRAHPDVHGVNFIGHAGKVLKLAAGIWNTHSNAGDARMETLAALAATEGAPYPLVCKILDLTTAEAVVPLLDSAGLTVVWDAAARRASWRIAQKIEKPARVIITGYNLRILGDSAQQKNKQTKNFWPEGTAVLAGVGPSGDTWLSGIVWRWITHADVLAGGSRQIEPFRLSHHEVIVFSGNVEKFCSVISDLCNRGKRVAIIASGDPCFYGLAASITRTAPALKLYIEPAVSAVQLAMARAGVVYAPDMVIASAHGRPISELNDILNRFSRGLILTDTVNTPQKIASYLRARIGNCHLIVCERLGFSDERVSRGSAEYISTKQFDALSVVYYEG